MDDLIQEVFLVVHSKLYTVEKRESLRSWIYSVVRRTASNHRRAKRTHADASSGPPGDGEALSREPTPLENTERSAGFQLLMSLLDQMEPPKREIFALVDVEDFSVPEAAELLTKWARDLAPGIRHRADRPFRWCDLPYVSS